jgi:ribose 5-phosphate isomerase B
MKIAIGCDHAGLNVKKSIMQELDKLGHVYQDFGTYDLASCDYPDYAVQVANAVASGDFEKGIIVCGTGVGVSIVANKVKGIRCAHCTDTFTAKACREHNDANVITFGDRITGLGVILDCVKLFLSTEFLGGRHEGRVNKIKNIEDENFK